MGEKKLSDISGVKELQQLFEDCNRSLNNDGFQETTGLLEQAFQQAIGSVVPTILLKRAEIFEKKADYGSAMNDLQRLIKVYPKAPMAYIHASWIYQLQGKECEAVWTLEEGVKAVPTDDKMYPDLDARRAKASDEMNRKNMRTLGRLSYELLVQILSNLDLLRCDL